MFNSKMFNSKKLFLFLLSATASTMYRMLFLSLSFPPLVSLSFPPLVREGHGAVVRVVPRWPLCSITCM
jgi:hypothetical protein